MFIWTTAGNYTITATDDEDFLRIHSTTDEALHIAINTLKLSDYEEGYEKYEADIKSEDHGFYVDLPRGTVCLWMQFELLNYIGYHNFGKELSGSNQASECIAYEKLMMALEP